VGCVAETLSIAFFNPPLQCIFGSTENSSGRASEMRLLSACDELLDLLVNEREFLLCTPLRLVEAEVGGDESLGVRPRRRLSRSSKSAERDGATALGAAISSGSAEKTWAVALGEGVLSAVRRENGFTFSAPGVVLTAGVICVPAIKSMINQIKNKWTYTVLQIVDDTPQRHLLARRQDTACISNPRIAQLPRNVRDGQVLTERGALQRPKAALSLLGVSIRRRLA
jgi:hypothetical protein